MLRTINHLVARLVAALDFRADLRVEVEQAVEAARRQHQALTEQAAAVIGNQRELEIKVARADSEVARLRSGARRAVLLAERAGAEGASADAERYESAAQVIAIRLAAAEGVAADLDEARRRAEVAAGAARHALEQNAQVLQRMLAERSRLLTQIEATVLQERLAESLRALDELAPRGAAPTLAEVQAKVDRRMGRAAGLGEVQAPPVETALLDVERAEIEASGRARLEALREQLRLEEGAGSGAPEKA